MAPAPANWSLPAIRPPSPPLSENGWVTSATVTGYGPPRDSGGRPCAAGNRPHKRYLTHWPPTCWNHPRRPGPRVSPSGVSDQDEGEVRAMTFRTESRITVASSAREVWAYVCDVGRWPEWAPTV